MDVVALISGGKDSCYSVLKAGTHGHNIIALGHIVPPCEEADSLMYQSVGSSAVSLIAEAMDLPLVIRKTHATAKLSTLTYTATTGDEVEDLVSLLLDVKRQFPTIQGVCSGALWSDYQRLRVENAASRTGLFSIAPLWRREQSELLDEMIKNGVDAVLIKVAGIGLDETHLGKSLGDMRPVLHKLEKMYGSHICGEGGEYETLVRWMPGFKKRLEFQETEVVHHTNDIVAPVSYLRLNKLYLANLREEQVCEAQEATSLISSLFLFEPKSYVVATEDWCSNQHVPPFAVTEDESIGVCTNYFFISLHSPRGGSEGVSDCCARLKHCLSNVNESLRGVISVQLHLHGVHGASYKDANKSYNEIFGAEEIVLPPARACVGMSRRNMGTFLEVLVWRGNRDCAVSLHVQSLSEWAPPCIGPYSQFVEEDGLVHVSGVLPLHAPTASVLTDMPAGRQVEVCYENLRRTLEAGRGEIRNIGLLTVYAIQQAAEEVKEAVFKKFNSNTCVKIILPVSALPKGALVEIKAVGVLRTEALSKLPSCQISGMDGTDEQDLCWEGVTCSNFTFITVQSRSSDFAVGEKIKILIDGLSNIIGFQPNPLAIQWCGLLEAIPNSAEPLQHIFPKTAVTTILSHWMPIDIKWVCIISLHH